MKRNLTGNVLEKSTMENWKKQASKERLLLLKTFTLASALQVIPQNLSTLLISTHGHGGLLARNRISTIFLLWSRLHSFKQFSLPNIFKSFRFEDWHNTFPSFRYTYNSAKNTPLCELFIFSRMVSSLALSQIESEREAPFCTLRSCVNTLV